MDSPPGPKTLTAPPPPHYSISTSFFTFPSAQTLFLIDLVPVLPSAVSHLLLSHSQRWAFGSEASKLTKKAQTSFSSSSFGSIVLTPVISVLLLFPFTHGISLRFRDPAGLDSCQEPFSEASIDREHIFKRLRSLTHLLSNINPSVITVGNSALFSVCGSCSTQNHTFLRI